MHLSATAQLKVPPHLVEAGFTGASALMLNNDAWLNVADADRATSPREHQIIFEAMASLANANEPTR